MPKRFPRAKDDASAVRVTGKTWNRLVSEVEAARNLTVTAPLKADVGPHGTALALAGAAGLRVAKADGSGIPAATSEAAPGAGRVVLYRFNGTGWVATTATVPALNLASGAGNDVGANKLVIVASVEGRWVVLWELCP